MTNCNHVEGSVGRELQGVPQGNGNTLRAVFLAFGNITGSLSQLIRSPKLYRFH